MNRDQNDYAGFAEEQFAADEYFQQWVLGADAANSRFWESYCLLHPAQKETIKKARLLVKELATGNYSIQPLSQEEKATIKGNIFQSIQLSSATGARSFFSGWKKNRNSWAAAAALAIIALPVYFLVRSGIKSAGKEKNNAGLFTVKTGPGEMKQVVLEDGTVVMLNANSSLQCNNTFHTAANREVYLDGNAFFRVQKDVRYSPFVIHAHSLVITVLGTELNVNARSAATEVELTRGKVRVEEQQHKRAAEYMEPGEKIILDSSGYRFTKTKISPELYSAWTEGKWDFRQTSLEEITALLHEYYGVNVVFNTERSRHLRINAMMAVTSLRKLIPVIEQTLQIKIEFVNNRLIVQ